ncbi:MAG: hypothetical protein OXK21_10210 [Chloroflexota bacterium]|nr:hypothetical protein [Chloroflexota bacterium]
MGTFKVPVVLTSMDGERSVEIEMVAGTRAIWTAVPACKLRELGIEPDHFRKMLDTVGDGRILGEAQAWAAIDGRRVPTTVVFEDDDRPALLGSHTLSGLFLDVDTDAEKIVPAKLVMREVPSVVPHPSPRYDLP